MWVCYEYYVYTHSANRFMISWQHLRGHTLCKWVWHLFQWSGEWSPYKRHIGSKAIGEGYKSISGWQLNSLIEANKMVAAVRGDTGFKLDSSRRQRQLNWPAAVHIKSKYSRQCLSSLPSPLTALFTIALAACRMRFKIESSRLVSFSNCHIASARRRSVNVKNYS